MDDKRAQRDRRRRGRESTISHTYIISSKIERGWISVSYIVGNIFKERKTGFER